MIFVFTGIFCGNDVIMADEMPVNYDSYVQIKYSNEDGLLSGEANDIEQTKDGKLWIGTYAGLFKYDGARFTLMNNISSINNVNCLYADEEGRLWVGTNDDGISLLINEHVMNVIEENDGLLSNSVKCIVCDSNGNYYIGTPNGISLVSLSGGVKITKNIEQLGNIISLSADKNGNVAAVSETGELYWMKDGEIVAPPIDLSVEYRAVKFTEDNRLLIGSTTNEICILDMSDTNPKCIKTINIPGIESINSFYITEKKEIFVCSDSGVAEIYEDYDYKRLKLNNFSNSIDNMLVDYQGNLWFSSSRLGLLKMCESPFIELFSEIGETQVVNSTQKWNGLLFCGTDTGLVIMDEEKILKVENELTELLKNIRVRCIKVDGNDNLWLATMGMGVYKIRRSTEGKYEIKTFDEADGLPGMRFRNINISEDGSVVAAGDSGVAVIRDDVVEAVFTSKEGLEDEKTLCTLEHNGFYYFGSDSGGISKVKGDKLIKHFDKKDGLSSNVILRMVYDSYTNGIFIVTSNGLCYMSPEGEIKKLDNFPYSNNYDMICEPDGSCWILSSAGIYVANTSELLENTKREYVLIDSKKGFRSSLTANSWLCRENDIIYLCCDSGVVKIDRSSYDMYSKYYRMILTSVEVDGVKHEINRTDTLKLTSKASKIVFEPEVLNYSMNDPYVSYMLEGYDENPTMCLLSELGKITYVDLNPGKYVFKIFILDGIDGKAVEAASYAFEKEIEMYQNWWFNIYIILIASLVLIWITWFITRTQTQKTLLKQKYELEYAKKQIEMGNETILSIARTVDAKDSNTSEHSFRVSEYSVAIARKLGYSDKKCENLRQMALLHDIGKIGIPDAILNKPAKLTDEEYEIMKSHVIRGGEILKDFSVIDNVNVGALYHHEKYDGSGYCLGLKGEEIPIEARIIGIADAFDAMTANRVYRKKLDINYVISELKRCRGTQFDPKLVDIMLSLIDDGSIDVESLYAKSKEER